MSRFFDIIVAGGGAAGMMAAIAASGNKKILIIEHNDKLGKKILQTGNGRCNLTNLHMTKKCYCNENADYAFEVIKDFDQHKVMEFFKDAGLLLHDRNGYVYPNSDQAVQVNEVLTQKMLACGVEVVTETSIIMAEQIGNIFKVNTDKGVFECDKLIIAMGSKAYPKSGSDGSGYDLVKRFGHKVVEPLPALTALKSSFKHCKSISGVRCDGTVKVFVDLKEIISERGEIQLTDYGISGIPVFQISRYAVKGCFEKKKVYCMVDFLPDYSEDELSEFILKKCRNSKVLAADVFSGMINKKLVMMLLKVSAIKPEKPGNTVTSDEVEIFVKNLKSLRFDITGYNSYDYGQVCQGGVSVNEIDCKTMESKIVKNLYFAGEIIDIDGICGGYNLQWAWSSGYMAGKAAGND